MYKKYLPLALVFALVLYMNINLNTILEPKRLKLSGAMQSLDMWAMQRAYPKAFIPDVSHYSAFKYSKANLRNETDEMLVDPWRRIGPLNIGGRTISLGINPQNPSTIYAGSASGGLWRSYSGGVGVSAWHYVSTGYPVLGIGGIAISPNDSNTIYIGTGEVYGYQSSIGGFTIRETRGSYGIGILKTTNNGVTWTKSLDWSYNQRRGVQVVRINPLNPNIIWAGTTEGTYRSYDAGTSWVRVDSTIMVTDLVINPIDTGTVFIACGNLGSTGNGIYRTTNSGGAWVKLTNGLPAAYGGKALLAMYKSSPNVVFASIGNGSTNNAGTWLCKTVNNGDSWIIVSTTDYATYQGWFSHFVGVNPVDSSKVIAAGVEVFKSTTGGTNLFQVSVGYPPTGRPPIGGPEGGVNYSHSDHHAIEYHPSNPDIIYFGNDGGVFRTTDGGESFEGCNGSYQTAQFYNGFSSAPTDSMFSIGGMQDNFTAFYDGDTAWYRVIGGDGCWTAINHRSRDTVYGSSQYLNISRSRNGGLSYSNISPPGGYNTSFVAPYVLGKVNPQIIYAGRTVVFKSTNSGLSWDITNNGSPLDGFNPLLTLSPSPVNDDVVYAATAPFNSRAKVFKTTSGGSSWFEITGSLPDRYMIDIAVHPTDDMTAYITLSGYGSSHIFKTSNGGANWIDINNNLPDVPTSAVLIDPLFSEHIYAGNDIGVYVSTNGGANWQEYYTGMPDASIVMDLSNSPLNRKLRVATHGNGVYERGLIGNPIGITPISNIAYKYSLEQNYPNPFNPVTNIKYSIPEKSIVKLILYDMLGREITTLVNEIKNPGSYNVQFNASALSSGVYFYRLETDSYSETKKMLLLK